MQELSEQYGFQYETVTADIDEQALGDRAADPAQLVALLAQAKAAAICERLKAQKDNMQGYLLTCDQVVVYQGKIREKPVSPQQVGAKLCTCWQMQCRVCLQAAELTILTFCLILSLRFIPLQAKEFIQGYSKNPAGTVGCTRCTVLESEQSYSAVDITWVRHLLQCNDCDALAAQNMPA